MRINPVILDWAMADSGMTARSLAAVARVAEADVQAWLLGESQPGATQLKSVAKALRRPTSFFFLPSPPARARPAAAMRAPIGLKGERDTSVEERQAIRQAARRQRIARWAADRPGVGLPPALKTPGKTAEEARSWLHWSPHFFR